MTDLQVIIQKLIKFRDERDWEQFHNSKDLALALSIEASELLELFLWKHNEDFDKERMEDELADVLTYALLLVEKHNLDVNAIIVNKIKKNTKKYPIDKAKGTAKKYNQL